MRRCVSREHGLAGGLRLTARTVATYQSLSRPERLEKYDPEDFGLIIVDEAHHAAARS
mgnify:CR=1 FL=1|jgi:ATP-dependent helicase IRC3